jgi:ADP-ribosylglycohydrolase
MTRDRYRGALLGLAIGDALGTTLEFKPPGTFAPITDIVSAGPFNLKPSEWTDDTSMALCHAESLIERCGFDAKDQMDRYCRWHEEGSLLRERSKTGRSLCRAESSRTTHGTKTAIDACRYSTGLILGALQNREKAELLTPYFNPINETSFWNEQLLAPEIAAIAAGSFKSKEPLKIKGSEYVVESLEAALWAFYRSESFREGALLAVNPGDDADTTSAIYGQLAGAFYGVEALPTTWKATLAKRDSVIDFTDRLYDLANCNS